MDRIKKYFPDLTERQYGQLAALGDLYTDWNSKINVISRKDIENLYEHHILHSLAIAKLIRFTAGTDIADVGTGGGFPGIPLAILFPDSRFTLIDSIGKKLKVGSDIAQKIGLSNVEFRHERAEEDKDKYQFVVSRAVMPVADLMPICQKLVDTKKQFNAYPNGLICLKGGDLLTETAKYRRSTELIDISQYFCEEYFNDKKVVYIQL